MKVTENESIHTFTLQILTDILILEREMAINIYESNFE